MNHRRFSLIMVVLAWVCSGLTAQDTGEAADAPDSDERKFGARSRAYDLEFSVSAAGNYKRRDTYWEGVLDADDTVIIPLQLFKGNDYMIAIGLGSKENVVAVTAFNCAGKVMPLIPDEQEGRLLLPVSPNQSGAHFLRLRLRNGVTTPVYAVMTYLYR